eukprot:1157822-Pelagomonas_calceolata.AAC.14
MCVCEHADASTRQICWCAAPSAVTASSGGSRMKGMSRYEEVKKAYELTDSAHPASRHDTLAWQTPAKSRDEGRAPKAENMAGCLTS